MSRILSCLVTILVVCLCNSIQAQPGWVEQVVPDDPGLLDVYFMDNSMGWVAGFATIAVSIDGGQTWTNRRPTPFTHFTNLVATAADSVWSTDGDSRIWWTFDGGESWQFTRIASGNIEGLDFNGAGTFLAVGGAPPPTQGPIYRSENGVDWVQIDPGFDLPFLLGVSFGNDSTAWAVGSEGVIIKTTDAGITWSHQQSGVPGGLNGVYFLNINTGWAVSDDGVMISTRDGGESWELQDSGVGVNLLDILFTSENRGWVVGNSGTLLYTLNGGLSWTELETNTDLRLVALSFPDQDNGWIVGNIQFASTGGILLHTTTGTAVSAELEELSASDILESYPNPFARSTVISFRLEQLSWVEIEIVNELGQRVSTISSGYRTAGDHNISWEARGLPNGVYFYRLSTDRTARMGSMVLMR